MISNSVLLAYSNKGDELDTREWNSADLIMHVSLYIKLFSVRVRCNQMFPVSWYLSGTFCTEFLFRLLGPYLHYKALLSALERTSIELCNNVITIHIIRTAVWLLPTSRKRTRRNHIQRSGWQWYPASPATRLWRPLKKRLTTYICKRSRWAKKIHCRLVTLTC